VSDTYGPAILAQVPAFPRGVAAPPRGANPAVRVEAAAASLSVVLAVVARLEQALDQESEALVGGRAADLRDFNARKSHGLLELSRACRALAPPLDAAAADRLRGLRAKLARNAALLKTHLAAVEEVAGMMAAALREADSDGTYAQFRPLDS
jgi:hypothetical protein